MTLHDITSNTMLTLRDLKEEYAQLKSAGETESNSFMEYYANVLDATLRGRNDCELVYTTKQSADRMLRRILAKI